MIISECKKTDFHTLPETQSFTKLAIADRLKRAIVGSYKKWTQINSEK